MYWGFYLLVLFYFRPCTPIRMKDQITIVIPEVKQYCIRLLNGTAAVGCQSDRTGNMGSVTLIDEPSDLSREFADLPYGITQIIAVVNVDKFAKPLIDRLREADFVVGILLIAENGTYPPNFSEDSSCPNQNFYVRTKTELQDCQWNKEGAIHPQGLRFLSFEKPIFLITNGADIDIIVNKCYNAFNRRDGHNRRCMAHMTQFMHAAGNAQICRRREKLGSLSTCDALQDYNLFAVLPPLSRADVNKNRTKIFMLSARMDMLSTFANSNGGDVSSLTSIIALLAVANAIGKKLNYFQERANETQRQLMFSFFHGESMGYIGSSRMVWEMSRHEFPAPQNFQPVSNVQQIGLEDLLGFLEVQQLQFTDTFHLHSSFDVYNRSRVVLDEIVSSVKESTRNFKVEFHKDKSVPFPPSSYHSILRETINIPGILLTSYGTRYKSGHINSVADMDITKGQTIKSRTEEYVREVAQAVLETTVRQVLDQNETKNFAIDPKYVHDLMDCFFHTDDDCQLFTTLMNVSKLPVDARNMFISVTGTSFIRRLINALLVHSLGDKNRAQNVDSESQCNDLNKNQNVVHFVWQTDPDSKKAFCYETGIYTTEAKSPAFDEDSYDFRNDTYSTWMESLWDSQSHLDLYLKADLRLDLYAALTAFFVVVVSIPLKVFMRESWFIDSHEPPTTTPHQL